MRKLDWSKIKFSGKHPTTKEALEDVQPFSDLRMVAKTICDEHDIVWDENATEATFNGNPVTSNDIGRVFNTKG